MGIEDVLDNGDDLTKLLRPLHIQLLTLAWDDNVEAGLVTGSFDLDNPFVQDVLDQIGTQITGICETSKDDVRRLVGKGADEGWGVDQLREALQEKFTEWSTSRAEMVARTETASAYERGNLAAWRESGQVGGKEWVIGPDSCPECQALNGKVVGLDEEFADGIPHPPAHPSCTCAALPVLSED